MKIPDPTRHITPVGWVALAAFGGLMFLVWHSFQGDPYDTDWNDPKQPATNVDQTFGDLPGTHQAAFRARNWPTSLYMSPTSIIGTF